MAHKEYLSSKDGMGRLRELAQDNAAAARTLEMFNLAMDSEASGWTKKIEYPGHPWDPSAYNGADNDNDAAVFAGVGHDLFALLPDTIPGYSAWMKKVSAHSLYKDPSVERKAFIASLSDVDKDELEAITSADNILTDIEKNMPVIDTAIEDEKDPLKKAWLEDARAAVEEAYHDAHEEYKKLQASLSAKATARLRMKGSIADTIAHLKKIGVAVPEAMAGWQKCIDRQKTGALSYLTQKFNLTQQEAADAEAIYKKNMAAFADMDKATVATIDYWHKFSNILITKGDLWSCGGCSDYDNIWKRNFGAKGTTANSTGKTFTFCRPLPTKASEYYDWGWKGDCALIVDPAKAILSVTSDLYNGGTKYGTNNNGGCTSLMTDASLTSACGDNIKRDALTKDLTSLPREKFMAATGLDQGMEILVVGGLHFNQCHGVKFFHSVPSFTPAERAALKNAGMKVYGPDGREVAI